MKAIYYGELSLHDGRKVKITDRKTADIINEEFEWTVNEATDRATKYTIRAVQCLFALKLGDRYGWTTDRLARLLKDVAGEAEFIVRGETSMNEDLADLLDNYRIDLREDGMIRVEHTIDDNIYAPGEWRPLSQRKPPQDGTYIITTDRGAVCTAHWYNDHFSGTAGKRAVAWREVPEPYEFWIDEVEAESA